MYYQAGKIHDATRASSAIPPPCCVHAEKVTISPKKMQTVTEDKKVGGTEHTGRGQPAAYLISVSIRVPHHLTAVTRDKLATLSGVYLANLYHQVWHDSQTRTTTLCYGAQKFMMCAAIR